jgi:hypothetical protein
MDAAAGLCAHQPRAGARLRHGQQRSEKIVHHGCYARQSRALQAFRLAVHFDDAQQVHLAHADPITLDLRDRERKRICASQPIIRSRSNGVEHEVRDGGIPSDIQVSVISADESGAPCDCPGGHCTCNVDCLAMCAVASAITNTIAFDVLPSRSMVAIETVTFPSSWVPIGDFDPPRPIA